MTIVSSMKAIWKWVSGAVVMLALGLGCGKKPASDGATTYDVKGVILVLEPEKRTVIIRHEEIPGYMRAMKMPFEVREASVLDGLEPYDRVEFKLHVVPKDSWADSFRVVGKEEPDPEPVRLDDPTAVSFYKEVPELDVGDLLPNYAFTNEARVRVQTDDYRGRVWALTFIFTRCPLPNFCPRMSERFSEAQALLKERSDAPEGWKLLSVSIDPVFDTPRVLAGYARSYQADPQRWNFAVGSYEQTQPLGTHFGLYFAREVSPANMNHNLRTVVFDAHGRVFEVFIGNEWTAAELVTSMIQAGQVEPPPTASEP
jgi:protein SCO1/2